METRAPHVLIGAFVLAAILAVFGFVYWLNNTGGVGRAHELSGRQFQGPVPGLLVGAGVLVQRHPGRRSHPLWGWRQTIRASSMRTISVAATTVRTDTKVGPRLPGPDGRAW